MDVLHGNLAIMNVADVLQWIGNARKTGLLTVDSGSRDRRVWVRDGQIVSCAASDPSLLLGQFLLARARIDKSDLRQAMERQEDSGKSLGDLLVAEGKLTEEQMHTMIREKGEETVYGLFDWPNADFRFVPEAQPPGDSIELDLEVTMVLLEGARRVDEMSRFRSVFPSDDAVLQSTDSVPEESMVANPVAAALYRAIDGQRTLAEILMITRASEYLGRSFLLRLAERGLCRVSGTRESRTADFADEPISALQALVAHREFRAAEAFITRSGLRTASDHVLKILVARADAGFLAEVYRTDLPPNASLSHAETTVSGTQDLTAEEACLLDLIDDPWTVRSLAWVAPMEKVLVLRSLLALKDKGLIRVESSTPVR